MKTEPGTPPSDEELLKIGALAFSFAEIRAVVDAFYTDIQNDPLLRVPFSSVRDWPHHIDRLTHFWWIRFGGKPFLQGTYSPVEKHFQAGFNRVFLERWLSLFAATLQKHLAPEKAQLWLDLASRMGEALSSKNELYKIHAGHQGGGGRF